MICGIITIINASADLGTVTSSARSLQVPLSVIRPATSQVRWRFHVRLSFIYIGFLTEQNRCRMSGPNQLQLTSDTTILSLNMNYIGLVHVIDVMVTGINLQKSHMCTLV